MKVKKLIIFDMDGVILNSEPVHLHSKKKILRKFGIDENIDLSEYVGVANEKLWEDMIKEYQIPAEVGELTHLQDELNFREICEDNIPLSVGLLEVLQKLQEQDAILAVASSSSRWFVERVLKRFDILSSFALVMTGDDVENKKPHPEIYQKVCKYFKQLPTNVIVVEDSQMGVLAAVTAGINCIAYVNPTSGNQNLSQAQQRVTKLTDILKYI